jgi:hypothetical protein
MKAVILVLAVVGVASAAPASAQISSRGVPSRGIPTTSTSRSTSVDGTWRAVGRDNSGTIYERRTYDSYGNIVVQQARRDANGNFRILSTRTVQSNGNRNDCQVGSTNGTVGDIIFGRSGVNNNCQYDNRSDRRAVDGVWRQVGQGRNNNSIYERRTYDGNGNVVIQRGRRNSNGSFTVLSTRTARSNRSVNRNDGNRDDRWDNRGGDDDDDDDDRWDNRRDDNDRSGKSEHDNRGRGKGRKGRD